jgi:aminomethyltransferase
MLVRETPLAGLHESAGARMVEFAGWRLPLYFSSVAEEAHACRRAAALFDVSHMGMIRLFGPGARQAARMLLTRDVPAIPSNCSAYALLCNESGGVLDDLIVMVESEEAVRLVVNAASYDKDLAWIKAHIPRDCDVGIEELGGRTFGLALQGPRAEMILKDTGLHGRLPIVFAAFFHSRLGDADLLVSRTGYTGEDGFELFGAAADAPAVWRALMRAGQDSGLLPAGLAARDALRQEAGYPLWGQDLDEETTPLEAGLGWAVDWSGDFIGRAALEGRTPSRRRIGFRVEEVGIARRGAPIFAAGSRVGAVTSGTYSHNLQAAIGQGYVDADAELRPGSEIEIAGRDRRLRCRVAKLPLVPKRTRRSWLERKRRREQ